MNNTVTIRIEEKALAEFEDAYTWYEQQSVGLGERFKLEVDEAFKAILKSPKGYEKFGKHRQFPMKDFPFIILFEMTKSTLFVDAIFHTSQDPEKKLC